MSRELNSLRYLFPDASGSDGSGAEKRGGSSESEALPRISNRKKKEIKKAEKGRDEAVGAFLRGYGDKELTTDDVGQIIQKLKTECSEVRTIVEPLGEDALVTKWEELEKELDARAAVAHAAIQSGDLAIVNDEIRRIFGAFLGMEEESKAEAGAEATAAPTTEVATPPSAAAVDATAPATRGETLPSTEKKPQTKEELLQAIEANKGITLFEPVGKTSEKRTKLGATLAKEMVEQLFSEFESPSFKEENPSVGRRRRIVDKRLRDLGVTRNFGEDVTAILDKVGVFAEVAAKEKEKEKEKPVKKTQPETSGERERNLDKSSVLDFEKANTLDEVYSMLEAAGDELVAVPAAPGSVQRHEMVAAKALADRLRERIPQFLEIIANAPVERRKGWLATFLRTIPERGNLNDAVEVFLRGSLRDSKVALDVERGARPESDPVVSQPVEERRENGGELKLRRKKMLNLHDLGWPDAAIRRLGEEGVKSILATQKRYIKLVPGSTPGAVKVAPVAAGATKSTSANVSGGANASPKPEQAPANLSKLMPRAAAPAETAATAPASAPAPERNAAATAATAGGTGTPETIAQILDSDPSFRTFFAQYAEAEYLLEQQNTAEIEKRRRAFVIKDQLATILYQQANGAIKGDFLLDFENPDSNLPKNQRAEFQKYVDREVLERPDQLLELAERFGRSQVLAREIATKKTELEALGGKEVLLAAEAQQLEMKRHLEAGLERTRRDSLFNLIPRALVVRMVKMAYKINGYLGWKDLTEEKIRAEDLAKRNAILKGRTNDQLSKEEAFDLQDLDTQTDARLAGLKRHNALGDLGLRIGEQQKSIRYLKSGLGMSIGVFSPITYSPTWWTEHPEMKAQLDKTEAALAEIRQKKQTVEQAEINLTQLMANLEALRTDSLAEIPPTIALVQYAQAQIRNTITSFSEDTAVEDLERIADYITLLANKDGKNTGKEPFEAIQDTSEVADRLHEAIVAQWGKRVFEVFSKTALNRTGALAEMEKTVTALLRKGAIGKYDDDGSKRAIVKDLLAAAFKKIDPTKGDGKERRMALMGVMINCGLLKKGEKLAGAPAPVPAAPTPAPAAAPAAPTV